MQTPSAQSLVDIANEKWTGGDAENALALYDKALAASPGDEVALSKKATLLLSVGDLENALKCHDELVELGPSNKSRRIARARVLAQLARYDDAIADLDVAAAGMTDNAARTAIVRDKALYLRRSGRELEAVDILTSHLNLNPPDNELLTALGDSLLDLGDVDEAVRVFHRVASSSDSGFFGVDLEDSRGSPAFYWTFR